MDSKKEKKSSLSELLKFAGNSKGKINLSIFLAIIGVLLGMLSYLSVAMLAAGFFDNSITKEGVLKWSLVALGGFIGKMLFTTEEVINAAKSACCHNFIMNLPKGYDTKVGDAGGKLSGGERQRITLARAILKDSNVILLDEATAFADPENEDLIQEALGRLIKGKTLVVIAHRLTTIQDADQIVVVENGKIVDKGSQRELLSGCNLYKNMWDKHMAVSAL